MRDFLFWLFYEEILLRVKVNYPKTKIFALGVHYLISCLLLCHHLLNG